jgi:hypothetical protein
VRNGALRSPFESERRLIHALSRAKGSRAARRRAMNIRRAIDRRLHRQYGSRERLRGIVRETVDTLSSAGCHAAALSAMLLAVCDDLLAASGSDHRSILTGRSDQEAILAEVHEIIAGRLT